MTTTIHSAPIISTGRSGRREAERQAIRSLIAETLGEDAVLSHHDDGAPYLSSHPDIYISISHCIDRCVLAVSPEPVGVDIETARPTLERIASKFLTPAEQARGPYPLITLMQLWSAKEAVFKCARITTLVVSAIDISPDLTTATIYLDGTPRRFTLTYPLLTTSRVITLAPSGE